MASFVALRPSEHSNLGFIQRTGWGHAAGLSVVGVSVHEISKLMPEYVLGFIQQGESYSLIAMLGNGTRNCYLSPESKWIGDYVPALLRAYPFAMLPHEDKKLLCIVDEHLTDELEHPLFEGEELSETVKATMIYLQQLDQSLLLTRQATKKLVEADVIVPWELVIPKSEGSKVPVKGIYRVDEAKLNQLDPDTYLQLRDYGAIALAYGQLYSMAQVGELAKRIELADKLAAQSQPADLDTVFGDADNTLKFNFDNL